MMVYSRRSRSGSLIPGVAGADSEGNRGTLENRHRVGRGGRSR